MRFPLPLGLGLVCSARVREVPGSNPGRAHQILFGCIPLLLYTFLFKTSSHIKMTDSWERKLLTQHISITRTKQLPSKKNWNTKWIVSKWSMYYEHFWSKNVTIFLPFFPKKIFDDFFKVKFDKCAIKLGKIYERFGKNHISSFTKMATNVWHIFNTKLNHWANVKIKGGSFEENLRVHQITQVVSMWQRKRCIVLVRMV